MADTTIEELRLFKPSRTTQAAVIQIVINSIFDQDEFKCGCQCLAYSDNSGNVYSLVNGVATVVVTANGTVLTPGPYTANGTWPQSILYSSSYTCTGGRDHSRCGAQYSEPVSLTWCPIDHPNRLAQLTPVPNPTYRAPLPAGAPVPGELPYQESGQADSTDATDNVGYIVKTPVPVTIPYTGANMTLAQQLMANYLHSTYTANGLGAAVSSGALTSAVSATLPLLFPATNITGILWDNVFMQVLRGVGLEGSVVLGTTLGLKPTLQVDPALQRGTGGTGLELYYLMDDCSKQGALTAPVEQPFATGMVNAALSVAGTGSAFGGGGGGGGGHGSGGGAPSLSLSANTTVWSALQSISTLLGGSSFSCISTYSAPMNGTGVLEQTLFTGYGKGLPTQQGAAVAQGNISQYAAALDWRDTALPGAGAKPRFALNIYYNLTGRVGGGQGAPTGPKRYAAIMNAAANAFAEAMLGSSPATATPAMRMLYERDMPKQGSQLTLDFAAFLGPLLYTWLMMLLLPVMVGLLVYEKEKNLRVMMKMQGLGDASYYLINYAYYFILHMMFLFVIWFFAAVLRIKMFTLTSPGIVVVFFILFTNVEISIAFLFSAIFSTAKTATVLCVVYVLIGGLLGEFLFQPYVESTTFPRSSVLGMEILVPFSLYRGLYEMAQYAFIGEYTNTAGLAWSDVGHGQGMNAVMIIFLIEWFVLGAAALYIDQVVSSGSGVKKHPLFFLESCIGKRAAAGSAEAPPPPPAGTEADDVARERERAEALCGSPNASIVAYRLGKTYPGQDGAPPKLACRNFSLAIPRGECFGLLGPNGAGKSTSINMLTGFLTPSHGTAFIEGLDILKDMDSVYTLLGVCPQHNLLWETLTAREHLNFYGRLKNLRGPALRAAVDKALQGVNLFANGVGDKQVGSYSGGMKRRLSVAISFIGNPPVVFLDEPSTGLDPASRAQLWQVVKEAKQRCAIVLTTHSMEEAEELCDRLGIFVDGALQCLGNPKELTNRYGGFLLLDVTVAGGAAATARVAEYVSREISKRAQCTYSLGGMQKFDIPADDTDLADVFQKMERARDELGIVDWAVANMTLEEVFIKLSRAIGASSKD